MKTTPEITPFHVAVTDAELEDLASRLARTRFPAALPGDGWDTGVPVGYLRELVEYWRSESTGAPPRPRSMRGRSS